MRECAHPQNGQLTGRGSDEVSLTGRIYALGASLGSDGVAGEVLSLSTKGKGLCVRGRSGKLTNRGHIDAPKCA
jgi:hypothetical protein